MPTFWLYEISREFSVRVLLLKSRQRKVVPGITTLAAKDKNPNRESSSAWVKEVFCNAVATRFLAICNFSGGRRASMVIVSSLIPKNSRI